MPKVVAYCDVRGIGGRHRKPNADYSKVERLVSESVRKYSAVVCHNDITGGSTELTQLANRLKSCLLGSDTEFQLEPFEQDYCRETIEAVEKLIHSPTTWRNYLAAHDHNGLMVKSEANKTASDSYKEYEWEGYDLDGLFALGFKEGIKDPRYVLEKDRASEKPLCFPWTSKPDDLALDQSESLTGMELGKVYAESVRSEVLKGLGIGG